MSTFSTFEQNYAALVSDVINRGEHRETRNANTRALFAKTLVVQPDAPGELPILQARKYHFKGVLGELAAFFRGPTCVEDFTKWGCNYWDTWADENGQLSLDYGNEWLRNDQIEHLKLSLATNPTDRRMIISGWQPQNLKDLSLPCCHYAYQFYVRQGKYLDMLWTQRSADIMLGVPADALLAYTWLIVLANEFGYQPGKVTMVFGDTHIYESHVAPASVYLDRVKTTTDIADRPKYTLLTPVGTDFLTFTPNDLKVSDFPSLTPLSFELFS